MSNEVPLLSSEHAADPTFLPTPLHPAPRTPHTLFSSVQLVLCNLLDLCSSALVTSRKSRTLVLDRSEIGYISASIPLRWAHLASSGW